MAQLIPAIDVEMITHGPEKAVAKALLAGLDDEWLIYYSYSWVQAGPKRLQEGEADFVLLHPRWGLLVVEVKGGRVEFDPADQLWRQNSRVMKESPFVQAQRNLYAILDRIHNTRPLSAPPGKRLRCPYGYAVALPDSRASGTAPPGGHDSILLDADSLARAGEILHHALRKWGGEQTPAPMPAEYYQAVRAGVLSTFRLAPSLAAELRGEGEALIRLTTQQAEALEGLYENQRVLIEGVAGSGKTLLALERARAYSREGKHVLVVCYNKNLAEHLNRLAKDERITIRHFHGLAADVCLKAFHRFEVPKGAGQKFWVEQVPQMMQDALDELPKFRFDAIIIDEGQDFYEDWFIVLEDFHRNPLGPLYIFYDRAQNVYGASLRFPDHQTRYKLGKNCRNTKRIAAACSRTIGVDIPVATFSPDGKPPGVFAYKDDEELRSAVTNLLSKLVREEKISLSSIAILSHRKPENSAFGAKKIGRYDQTTDVATWQADKAVWFSTIKAFKGLEADILLLVELPEIGSEYFDKSDLYVAASRAKHRLLVFCNTPSVKQLLVETT